MDLEHLANLVTGQSERIDRLVQTTADLSTEVRKQNEDIKCIHDKIHPLYDEYEYKKRVETEAEKSHDKLIKNLRIASLLLGVPGVSAFVVWLFEKLAH